MNFLFPIYLYALSLIAIPIIIHFFNFQRAKTVYFTNVEFLRTVKEVTNARSKLKNILVLLARILFIIFLVLAFARPFIPREGANENMTSNLVSIYLDNSYSNQNTQGNQPLLDLGVFSVEQITKVFPQNTLYHLQDNTLGLAQESMMDAGRLVDKVTTVKFANASKTLETIYQKQIATLQANSPMNAHHVFWISDFQKSSVGPLENLVLDTANQFYLMPLRPTNNNNIYVDSLWLDNPFIRPGENNLLQIRLKNFGDESLEDRVIKLFIDENQAATSTVSMAANSTEVVEMNFSVEGGGSKACRIAIEDYPVTFDDDYFFTLRVAPKIKIVHINMADKGYIRNVFSTESFFEVVGFDVSSIDYSAIEDADLVILENLPEIDEALGSVLNSALEKGISLAVFPGAQANIETYTSILKIPFSLKLPPGPVGDQAFTPLALPEKENPFFEGVFEGISANMSTPSALQTLTWNTVGTDLLRFRNNQPFLTQVIRGSSTIYLFASPLAEDYTNFAKHAMFVPTMYRIGLLSKTSTDKLAYSFQEDMAIVNLDSIDNSSIFQLKNQQIELVPSQRLIGSKLFVNIPRQGIEAGNFQVMATSSGEINGHLSFNYGKEESELEYYSNEELAEIFGKYPNVQLFEDLGDDQFVRVFQERAIATPLWRYALVLALLFLLAEVLLIRFWKEL